MSEPNPDLTGAMQPAPPGESAPDALEERRRSARGVLCVKCEHLNPVHLEVCEFCRTHLWVSCRHCGAKNRRVNIRCDECHRRLHKGRSSSGRSRGSWTTLNLWVVGTVIGGIVFVLLLLFLLSGQKWLRLW